MARESIIATRLGLLSLWVMFIAPDRILLDGKDPKITVEELVAKHLTSIGAPEARAAAKSRIADGTVKVTFRMPKPGQIAGKCRILSDGKMMRFDIDFGPDDGERLAYDGRTVDVGQIKLRVRSHLADFIHHYSVMLREGLLCGTMTTAWPFLDLDGRQPKLDYTGLKKIDGKALHEIRYRAKRDPGDVQVAFYFNPETCRHVYSEYRMIVRAPPVQGTDERGKALPDTSSSNDNHYKIQEWFDDFRAADSLYLPHTYRLSFNRRGPSQAVIFDYDITLTQIRHNQDLDLKSFTIP